MKIPFLYTGLFLWLLFLCGCVHENNQNVKILDTTTTIQANTTTTVEIEKKPSSLSSCAQEGKCDEGFFCYDSQYTVMGPNGIITGPQEGDLLCHKICKNDSDCGDGECHKEVDIRIGDLFDKRSFCN